METILLVVQLIIALALIGAVLIQRSDSDGFGLGSGSGSNFMTGRAAANLLTRTTAILATLFILNSLALGIIAHNRSSSSIADTIQAQEATDAAPEVPVPGEGKAPSVEKKATPKPEAKEPAKPEQAPAKPKSAAKKEKPASDEPSVPVAE